MAVKRFLGPGWASVHGPADERDLALWTLDAGFGGIAVGPSTRPIAWAALRAQVADVPFTMPALFVAGSNEGLASPNDRERRAALDSLVASARSAIALGIADVVFEPGTVAVTGEVRADDVTDARADWSNDYAAALRARRAVGLEAALDRVCRAIFELTRAVPEARFVITPSRMTTGLGDPDALAAIFEDLASLRLGFWANPSISVCRSHVLGEDPGAWLEGFADRMVGLTLSDAAERVSGLPPGAGVVDYGMVASYVRRESTVPGVVELDPAVPATELAGVHSFLSKFGL